MRVATEQTIAWPPRPLSLGGDAAGAWPAMLASACVEYEGDLVGDGAPAGALRRAEFALGRLCAAFALGQLDAATLQVGRGERGVPIWPDGFVGSITHTLGFVAAVVARAEDCLAVGLDAERTGAVSEDLWPLVFSPAEIDGLRRLRARRPRALAAARMFTAKEAYYKAQHPRTGRRLGFKDASVTLAKRAFAVSSRSDRSGPFAQVTGQSLARPGTVIAVIVVPPPSSASGQRRM
jgi:4'-phosphopantetheinyl transferase EntD